MASLEEIARALKSADAAGDTVAAQKLAQAYRAEQQRSAQPAPQPAGQRGGMVTEGTISREDYMRQRGPVNEAFSPVPQPNRVNDTLTAPGIPFGSLNIGGGTRTLPASGNLGTKTVKPDFKAPLDLDAPQSIAVPEKMTRAQSVALGVTDMNPARMVMGDRGFEAAMTESLQDNPMSTRGGQALALTSGGGAQLTNRAILAAPKLVPAAVAARVAGQSVPARLARYGGRLATLGGIGAADFAAYNFAAEAPNLNREQGKAPATLGERADYAASELDNPWGYAPLPAASLLYRGLRGGATAAKNTAQATMAANKSAPAPEVMAAGVPGIPKVQWRGGAFTPSDVKARVAMGGIDPKTNASVREIAIDRLLKEGFDPNEAEKAVRILSYNGYSNVDEMLFEIDNNLAELATAVGRVNRPGQKVLRDEFAARRETMPDEIQTALREAVGASGDDLETFAANMAKASEGASSAGYASAHARQVSDDTWQRITGIMGEVGEDAIDAARKGAQLARNGAMRRPEYIVAAKELDDLATAMASGGIPNAKPSTLALDYLDRGINRKVGVASRAGDKPYSASLLDFRNALRKSGLDADTGLNEPRAIYAQYQAAARAMEFGEKAFGRARSLRDMKNEFVQAARQADEAFEEGIGEGSGIIDQALMMGWVRGAENAIESATNPGTLIRQLYGSQRQRDKMLSMLRELPDEAPAGIKSDVTKKKKALVGSKGVAQDYRFDFTMSTGERVKGRTTMRNLFDRQKDMLESERMTVGGSPTAGASDAIANQGGDARRLQGALSLLKAPQEIPWKAASAVIERITQPMIYNPAISRELGELLATRGRDRLLAVIDEIRARQIATGRGPKPPGGTPALPPAAGPIRAGGFAGFGAKKPRLGDTKSIPEAAAVLSEQFKPRKITRAATQQDWEDASQQAFDMLKAQASKQDGFEPGARVWQEKAPDSLTDPAAPPRFVFEDLAERILRSRGIDPDPVYGRMLAERPTNAETEVFQKTAGHYAGKARANEREGMAMDAMDDTDAAIESMSQIKPPSRLNGGALGTEAGQFVGGAAGSGFLPMESTGDWKEDARNRLMLALGTGTAAVAGPRLAQRFARGKAGDVASAGVGGPRKPATPKMDKQAKAIKDSVAKIAKTLEAKGTTPKPQQPEMRVGRGMSKVLGLPDDPKASMKVASDMLKAGRSSDEIWEATQRVPIKIEGRTILMRAPGSSPEEVQAAFWQEMAKPYSKRAAWAQKGTEGIWPMGPNSIARKSIDERLQAAKAMIDPKGGWVAVRDIWEETGVVVILKDEAGQMVVPRNGTVRAGWEPVALMDGKQFKSLDEAFDDMRAVAKLPRSEQPEWYRKQFSEVLNTGSLRKVGKGEYAARQVGEAIKSRPRVVALTAGGTLAAGAAAKNELDRQKKNAFAE